MLFKNQSTIMKTILLLFCLVYTFTAFCQSPSAPLNINIDLSERYPTQNPVATGYKKTVVQYQNIDKEQLENNQALNIFLGKLQQLTQLLILRPILTSFLKKIKQPTKFYSKERPFRPQVHFLWKSIHPLPTIKI